MKIEIFTFPIEVEFDLMVDRYIEEKSQRKSISGGISVPFRLYEYSKKQKTLIVIASYQLTHNTYDRETSSND